VVPLALAVAPSITVLVSPINVLDANEIERDVAAFAHGSNSGLIVTASPLATLHRDLIVAVAARHRLPAVYYNRGFVIAGGLISYGPDFIDQYRRAAGYVDRILKGEKPADLPVQAPTKYELVVNLKTAKDSYRGELPYDCALICPARCRGVLPALSISWNSEQSRRTHNQNDRHHQVNQRQRDLRQDDDAESL